MKCINSHPLLLMLFVFALSFCLGINTAQAAPGDLDINFGTNGIVTTDIDAPSFENDLSFDKVFALAIQPDGKIIATGYSNGNFALARYHIDGTLDQSFGDSNGFTSTNYYPWNFTAYAVVVQPNGKIVVSGSETDQFSSSYNYRDKIVRYHSNGSLDTSFGDNGIITTPMGGFLSIRALTIQNDGKILVGGNVNAKALFTLIRYNENGSLDTSFGNEGIVTTDIASNYSDDSYFAHAIALQPDGKILLGGNTNIYGLNDFALVRYNKNGSIDTTFGNNGYVIESMSFYDHIRAIAVQPDGKIILGGYTGSFVYDFALVRLNSDGLPDSTCNNYGFVSTNFPGGVTEGYSMALQPDGKIVIVGTMTEGAPSFYAIARYSTDCSLDSTFGDNGKIIGPNGNNGATTVAIHPDGKIIVGGYMSNISNDFLVISILANDINNDGIAEPWDLTPDAMNFTEVSDVTPSTSITSSNITISGLDDDVTVPVTIIGGEYSINGSNYTSNIGYAKNSDLINVRHTTANSAYTQIDTILTIGGLHAINNNIVLVGSTTAATFSSTTGEVQRLSGTANGGGGSLGWLLLIMLSLQLTLTKILHLKYGIWGQCKN